MTDRVKKERRKNTENEIFSKFLQPDLDKLYRSINQLKKDLQAMMALTRQNHPLSQLKKDLQAMMALTRQNHPLSQLKKDLQAMMALTRQNHPLSQLKKDLQGIAEMNRMFFKPPQSNLVELFKSTIQLKKDLQGIAEMNRMFFKPPQSNLVELFKSTIQLNRNLQAQMRELRTPTFRKFNEKWGWLFDQKSIQFHDDWYEAYKKYGDTGFEDKISKWLYSIKNINKVLKDIKSKFPERLHVIKEGLYYHRKMNYSCSIALLLPHAEGILWELGMKKKYVRKGYNSKKKYSRYRNDSSDEEWKLQDLSKKLFPSGEFPELDKFHGIIVRELFCEGPRNKILHGRNIYNKKEKEISRRRSTLLILTLWRLSDEF